MHTYLWISVLFQEIKDINKGMKQKYKSFCAVIIIKIIKHTYYNNRPTTQIRTKMQK